MKQIVYVIIAAMALVFLVNISALSKTHTLKVELNNGTLEFNPLY